MGRSGVAGAGPTIGVGGLDVYGDSLACGFPNGHYADFDKNWVARLAASLHIPSDEVRMFARDGSFILNEQVQNAGFQALMQSSVPRKAIGTGAPATITSAPYQASSRACTLCWPWNDLGQVDNTAQTRTALQHNYRAMIAMRRAAGYFRADNAAFAYTGTWAAPSDALAAAYVQGTANKSATPGDVVTFTTPSDNPGGTWTLLFSLVPKGFGATATFGGTGATDAGLSGATLSTEQLGTTLRGAVVTNGTVSYAVGDVATVGGAFAYLCIQAVANATVAPNSDSAHWTLVGRSVMVQRFPHVAAGARTLTATVSAPGAGSASTVPTGLTVIGAIYEGTKHGPILVCNQPKSGNYATTAFLEKSLGTTYTSTPDADIADLNTKLAALCGTTGEFGTDLVVYVDIDSALAASSANFESDWTHPSPPGYDLMAQKAITAIAGLNETAQTLTLSGGITRPNLARLGIIRDNAYHGELSAPRGAISGATTPAVAIGDCYYLALPLAEPAFLAGLAAQVTVAGAATLLLRMGVFHDIHYKDKNKPGDLLADLGTVATNATGLKTLAASMQYLDPGLYWLAVALQGTSTIPTLATAKNVNFALPGTFDVTATAGPMSGYKSTGITGAFASAPTVADYTGQQGIPLVAALLRKPQ